MDKLSERLWIMRVSLPDLQDSELATLDEAIKQIERYEDAPVGFVMGQGLLTEGKAAIVSMEDPAPVKGQRVRIVLDKEG